MVVHRYLFREILQTLLAVFGILLLIFLGQRFTRYLADAAAGQLQVELIFRLLSTVTLGSTVILVPFAFYIAVLLAFGRLYRDNEMTALAAAGVGLGQVLRPIVALSCVVAVFVSWLALSVGPWAVEQGIKLREQVEAKSDLSVISAGQFRSFDMQHGVFYVENVADTKLMNRIFVRTTTAPGGDVLAAESGYRYTDEHTGDEFLVLLNGHRYEGDPGSEHFRVYEYAKASVRLEAKAVQPLTRKRDSTPTMALWQSDDPRDIAELQWRLSMPLSTILLGVLAVLVSRTTPREGRYARLFGAILIYIIYFNLMAIAQSWTQRSVVPASLGMWWVHVVLLSLIALMVIRHFGWRYLYTRAQHVHP